MLLQTSISNTACPKRTRRGANAIYQVDKESSLNYHNAKAHAAVDVNHNRTGAPPPLLFRHYPLGPFSVSTCGVGALIFGMQIHQQQQQQKVNR